MNPLVAVCALALCAVPGCAVRTWQFDSRPVPRAVAEGSPPKVRLTLRDGATVWVVWPVLERDSIRGFSDERAPRTIHVPLADVRAVARLRVNWSASVFASAAVTAGVVAGFAYLVCGISPCVVLGNARILPPGPM